MYGLLGLIIAAKTQNFPHFNDVFKKISVARGAAVLQKPRQTTIKVLGFFVISMSSGAHFNSRFAQISPLHHLSSVVY